MLIFGNELPLVENKDFFYTKVSKIYNLCNLIEIGVSLQELIPPVSISDNRDFDMFYANFILTSDVVFVKMMSIMMDVYNGEVVYVLVDEYGEREYLIESLLKFIQERYGYVGYQVSTGEDLIYISGLDHQSFSLSGIYNFDIDKERYVYLTTDFKKLIEEAEKDGEFTAVLHGSN